MKVDDPPIPSGGITTPRRPLPMKGEGERPGSSVVRRKVESLVAPATWAWRRVESSVCADHSPANTITTTLILLL
jgi:hypothetical protein